MNAFVFVAAKEEEKQKLMKWSSELKLEREQLEQRVKQLSNSITVRNTVKAAQQRGDKSRLLFQSSVRFTKYTESGASRSLVAAFADATNVNIVDYISWFSESGFISNRLSVSFSSGGPEFIVTSCSEICEIFFLFLFFLQKNETLANKNLQM